MSNQGKAFIEQIIDETSIEVTLTKNARGLGLSIAKNSEGQFYIKELLGEPALTDGRLKKNDKIKSVNGESISTYSHAEAIEFLRAQPKTVTLILTRRNHDNNKPVPNTIKKDTHPPVLNVSLDEIAEPVLDLNKDKFFDELLDVSDSSCINLEDSKQTIRTDIQIEECFDDLLNSEDDVSDWKCLDSVRKTGDSHDLDNSFNNSNDRSSLNASGNSSRVRSQLRAEALMFVKAKEDMRKSGASDDSNPRRKRLNRSQNRSDFDDDSNKSKLNTMNLSN